MIDVKALAERHNDYIIGERRYFHTCPELSFEEWETTRALAERLEKMGVAVSTFPDYPGLVGEIRGGRPGATVMLRSDIDGLPVEEKTGLPFASTNGNMHACGHDCHMAMLLGAAKILTDVRDELPGTVKLLFQSAEETCYGAKYYIEHGVLNGVDAIMGMHIWAAVDVPNISIEPGVHMASCGNFKITVKGVSAHGSAPHLGRDAIVAAASIVMNLQTQVSRVNDSRNPLIVSIGTIAGGQRFNIIANHVELEGTARTFSREVSESLEEDIRRIVVSTAEALGCTAELEYHHRVGPLNNEYDDITRLVENAAVKLYGGDCLQSIPPVTASEDFAMYLEKIPGAYAFLGCRNTALGKIYSNHNDKFDVDESMLQRGSALFAQFAVDFLNEKAK